MSTQFLSVSSTQFLSVSSTQFLRGFLTERDLPGDSRHFCTKTQSFLEKWLDSFLCTWNMSIRFLNSEKNWVLVSYKAVSYRKKCVQWDLIHFFIKNLALKWVFSFLALQVLSFFAVSYLSAICVISVRKCAVL